MVFTLIRHRVTDYTGWKATFDANALWRMQGGELSYRVFRDADDERYITIIQEWDGLEVAQAFIQSHDLRRKMQDAGVIGEPTVLFLTEIESGTQKIE